MAHEFLQFDLLDADLWQGYNERILAGHVHDVFPYEAHKRFAHARNTVGVLLSAAGV
jgi:isocitrate dehydrogenase kinase/phosphatase